MEPLRDVIRRAISTRNSELAGRISNYLWFEKGLNYDQAYSFVNGIEPISMDDWEELLYEADADAGRA